MGKIFWNEIVSCDWSDFPVPDLVRRRPDGDPHPLAEGVAEWRFRTRFVCLKTRTRSRIRPARGPAGGRPHAPCCCCWWLVRCSAQQPLAPCARSGAVTTPLPSAPAAFIAVGIIGRSCAARARLLLAAVGRTCDRKTRAAAPRAASSGGASPAPPQRRAGRRRGPL
eukprot:scaffold4344_cov207-Prasinococcus_capsulatus_cf.AAC.5